MDDGRLDAGKLANIGANMNSQEEMQRNDIGEQGMKNWRSYLMWTHRPGFGTKLYDHSTPYSSICGQGEGKGPLVACILPSWAGRRQVEVQDLNPPPHCHYSGVLTH